MKKVILTFLFSVVFVLCTAKAWANPSILPKDSGTANQVYQDINYIFTSAGLPSPGLTSSGIGLPEEQVAPYEYTGPDSYWAELAPHGSPAEVAAISIGAANTNTLGIFQQGSLIPSSIQYLAPSVTGFNTLGNGTQSDPFLGGTGNANGHFGFALQTVSHVTHQSAYWYSDPSLNSDGNVHMLAYYLPQLSGTTFYVNNGISTQPITLGQDTYLMGWEDQTSPQADWDYKDTVFLVSNVIPAPEPMTMALFGLGVIGLFGFSWRKRLVLA